MGAQYSVEEIPADLRKKAEAFRNQLVEIISETDDVLMEKYLEGEDADQGRDQARHPPGHHRYEDLPGSLRHRIQE